MKKVLLGLVVVVLGVGAGWYVFRPEKTPENAMPVPGTTGVEEMVVTEEPTNTVVASASVQYTDTGFVPKELTVKVGTTVTFTNGSAGVMWVASAPHPTHTIYPEFDQKMSVDAVGTYEFTFTKVGTWKYHNHVKATDSGMVIVTE